MCQAHPPDKFEARVCRGADDGTVLNVGLSFASSALDWLPLRPWRLAMVRNSPHAKLQLQPFSAFGYSLLSLLPSCGWVHIHALDHRMQSLHIVVHLLQL